MIELLTAAQMRAIEGDAIRSGAVTGLDLMERAGRGTVDAIFDAFPNLLVGGTRAVVLCGPGNNGGDGFVVARILKDRGWDVTVYLYGDADRLPPDAKANCTRWQAMGEVHRLDDPEHGIYGGWADEGPDLIVDAIFGTGLTRDLDWAVEQALSDIDEWKARHRKYPPFVAVDMPSGLCSDSGRERGVRSVANLTVTFHRPKLGQYLAEGPRFCGRVVVVDIGLPDTAVAGAVTVARAPYVPSKHEGHKYDHGHVLVLAGGPGHGGAARLAARGALRIGAGVVTLGCPPEAVAENAARLDAVMVRPVAGASALERILADDRITTVCAGPGLGLDRADSVAEALRAKTHGRSRKVVLDADALTLLADDTTLFAQVHANCVLTPHWGEFKRLFPDIAARCTQSEGRRPLFSKVDAARAAAERAGCTVLVKGADTVIAAPDGRCAVNSAAYDKAARWLATAGSGDVLAGFVAGLLARGSDPLNAAVVAAWLHVECALAFGPGLIAEDLPEALPGVFRALGV